MKHPFSACLFLLLPSAALAQSAGDASPASARAPLAWDARHAEHLLNRAGFGARTGEIACAVAEGQAACVERLVTQRADIDPFFVERVEDPSRRELRELSDDERQKVQRETRERDRRQMLDYTAWWMERAESGQDPLQERMVLFWHGLFTSSVDTVRRAHMILAQDQLIREEAVGNYARLLSGMLKDPALLTYLDNQVNRKGNPNENLARELMELFSLGIGNYTEQDIKEVARALTGRGTDERGAYAYNAKAHDDGEKSFLGQKGKFDGDDVVRIVLAQDACPRYVARRILTYLEGVEPSKARLDEYAAFLRAQQFELKPFLRKLFLDPEFYREEILGARVQGPVDFMVGMSRRLGLHTPPMVIAAGASLLGQRLFAPPNVKGWDEGESWITTSSLMQRGNLAGLLLGVVQIDDVIRADDPDMLDQEAADDAPAGMQGDTMQMQSMRPKKALDKQAGLKGAGSVAYQALRRVQDSGWAPNLNFSARLERLGARTDREIVERMLDDLLAIEAPADTLQKLRDFLANERAALSLADGHLFEARAEAEKVLRRLAHLILSLPEAQLG